MSTIIKPGMRIKRNYKAVPYGEGWFENGGEIFGLSSILQKNKIYTARKHPGFDLNYAITLEEFQDQYGWLTRMWMPAFEVKREDVVVCLP